MRIMLIRLILILTLCSVPIFAQARDKVFDAQHYTLDNGLEIVVIPNHRAPVVTHMVWYKTGAADEDRGKSGIAHFLEHLMFKGSKGLAPGEFSRIIRSLGGNDNAFTSQDFTAYFQSISVKYLELAMRMEASRMRGLNPPLEEVESELKVILEERRQRIDNTPNGRFDEALNAALYVNHPYGIPTIGWFHEIERLTWDDAKAFYDHHYGPNNAILVVSGDVTGEQVHELAKDIYGRLPRIDVPKREWTKMPPLQTRPIIKMHDKSVQQPLIQLSFIAPSAHQDKKTSLALQVLEDIMGGGPTSRLYKALAVDQKLVSSVGFYYSANNWNNAEINLYASPLPGHSLDKVRAALLTELDKLLKDGVTPTEVKEAKARLQDEAIYARDSLAGPAMVIGQALTTGSTLDDIEYWPDDISAVTVKDINEAAKSTLNYETIRFVTGYLMPENYNDNKAKEDEILEKESQGEQE